MDQYLVQFEFSMMYFDMIELIQLINESENEQLLDYADDLQIIIDEQTKTTKTSKNNDKLIIGDVSGLLFDFWHYTKNGNDNDTPADEIKEGVEMFLSNYKR